MSSLVLSALGAGALSGLMITASQVLGPFGLTLFMVALVPTFAVGLSRGLTAHAGALAVATLLAAAASDVDLGFKYLVVFALPQLLVVWLALQSQPGPGGAGWYPPGRLLAWLVAIGCLFVSVATVVFMTVPGGIVARIQQDLEPVLRLVADLQGLPLSDADIGRLAPRIAALMPAAMTSIWLIIMVINGVLAQAIVGRSGRALRPSPPFSELVLPDALVYGLGGALLLKLVPGTIGFLGMTLREVVLVPFVLLGLAVVHAIARDRGARPLMLFATYLALILLPWLAAMFLASVGLVEQVFGLRKRLKGAAKPQEDE